MKYTTSTSHTTSKFIPTRSELGANVTNSIINVNFNDLICESNMSQRSAEIWASRRKQWNLVENGFQTTGARKRANVANFDDCFAVYDAKITYCIEIAQITGASSLIRRSKVFQLV